MTTQKLDYGFDVQRHGGNTIYTVQTVPGMSAGCLVLIVGYIIGAMLLRIMAIKLLGIPSLRLMAEDVWYIRLVWILLEFCMMGLVAYFLLVLWRNYLGKLFFWYYRPQIAEIASGKLVLHRGKKRLKYDIGKIDEVSIFNKRANILRMASKADYEAGTTRSDLSRKVAHYTPQAKDALSWTIQIQYESSSVPVFMHLKEKAAEALFADFTASLFAESARQL